MKKALLLATSLLCLNAGLLKADSLYWSDPDPGNINDSTPWDTLNAPTADDRLYFEVAGDYTVGATSNLAILSMETRGTSGTVTFDLGAHTLDASSTIIFNRDTVWASGTANGNLQIANAVQGKHFTISGPQSHFSVVSAMIGRSSATTSANNNQWTIANGAQLHTSKNGLIIGNNDTNSAQSANGNSLLVSGASTFVKADGGIIIGNLQTAGGSANNNSIQVNDGAIVETTGLTIGRRASTGGSSSAATGNSLTVGGEGAASRFTSSGGISIGPVGGNNVINVLEGGTLIAQGNTTVNNRAGNAIKIKGGTYDASGNQVLLYQSGLVSLEDGGTLSAKTLNLQGTFQATGSNTVNLEELLSGSTSTYRFVLKGSADYTQVAISGDAQFDGVLNVTLDAGYTPLSGDSIQLFSFNGSTGSFTKINLPTLADGLEWDITTLYQNGTIQVIPEPRTAAIQITGLLAMCLFWSLKKR